MRGPLCSAGPAGAACTGGEPRAVPGVKLFAIFKGPIVVVANEIPHLDFPQADFGDVIPVYHHIFQGAGVTQPSGPQDAEEEEDDAAGGHGAGSCSRRKARRGKAERWSQLRAPAQPEQGFLYTCTRAWASPAMSPPPVSPWHHQDDSPGPVG